jgi:hypothetical protein
VMRIFPADVSLHGAIKLETHTYSSGGTSSTSTVKCRRDIDLSSTQNPPASHVRRLYTIATVAYVRLVVLRAR